MVMGRLQGLLLVVQLLMGIMREVLGMLAGKIVVRLMMLRLVVSYWCSLVVVIKRISSNYRPAAVDIGAI